MFRPDFAGGAGGEADALVDELLVPRLADAERIHGADLHVGHHLRRRHHDGGDVLVRVDAAGRQPVANPQVVGAAGEGHGDLDLFARSLLGLEGRLQRGGIGGDGQILVFIGDRDGLSVEIEPRQDVHRRGHVVLRHLAGRDQIRHGRQDMRAVDAVGRAAQHEIVARGAPGRLLGHLHIGDAVLGEETLFLGDNQRRGVDERDVAEHGLGDFRRAGGVGGGDAEREGGLHGGERGGGAGGGPEECAAGDAEFFGVIADGHAKAYPFGHKKSRVRACPSRTCQTAALLI